MSAFVRAKLVTGGARQLPSGATLEPGDTAVLPRGEAEGSDDWEVVGGPASWEECVELTGVGRPEPKPPPKKAKSESGGGE